MKKKKKKKITRILRFAKRLNKEKPESEKWFWLKYSEIGLMHFDDRPNLPIRKRCIGDVVNETFKYVIEVDGGFHKLKWVQERDKRKTKYLKRKGYRVFRIIAFDNESFNQVMENLIEYRNRIYFQMPENIKIKLEERQSRIKKYINNQFKGD